MKRIKRAAVIMLLAVLVLPSNSFAQVSQSIVDPVQNNSTDTATIYVGKVLTVSQENKFPEITDFHFTIESVKAWDNANVSAQANGKTIAAADMPQPSAVSTEHQKVSITDDTHAVVDVGSFTGNANTSKADTSTEKFRATPVNIKFSKAGYYVYKITERVYDEEKVAGMSYDNNSYYVAVYVCNKTDALGNTTSGVYVHDITSYRNDTESDYAPDLSDIQNTPDSSTPASGNTYDNFAKVGISTPEPGTDPETGIPTGPNKLEAYKFFNDQTTHDVVVTNNVTGNLGDITKEFEYTVTITGLEKNKEYTTGISAQDKTEQNVTTSGADILSVTGGKGTIDSDGKTFRSDAEGNATFMIKLADDEVIVFNALPATAKYTVEEHSSDHIASFTSESTENDTWVMSLERKANNHSDMALSTATETVDAVSNVPGRTLNAAEDNDGTVTINFRNHRDLLTPTGLPFYGDFTYALAIILIGMTILLAVRRRKEKDSIDEQLI